MGKGDRKSKRGKRILGSYGNTRRRKKTTTESAPAPKAKAKKTAAKKTAKESAAKESK